MSLYGIAFYGIDLYGYSAPVDFDASPFTAEPEGYDRIMLSWTSPTGTWDTLRVVRNSSGFPVDEKDGEILATYTAPAASLIDADIRRGAWHYYAIWVHSTSGWSRAGIATTLMLEDHGFSDRLYEHLPRYHQLVSGALDDGPAVENESLKQFLQVLGYGLDYIKSQYNSLRVLNDPMKNHLSQLLTLADQLGVPYIPATPTALFRSRVGNAGTLAREKGTVEHLRSVVGMTVGWDIEVRPGKNLMLNEDTASFAHPVFDTWDAARNYPATERASFNGFLYEAKVGGAYGVAQKPSGTATTNTWWTYVAAVTATGYNSSDGALAGWGLSSFTGGVSPGTLALAMGLGMASPYDAAVQGKNSLYFTNNASGAVTADFGVLSVKATTPEDVVRRGVPIPAVRAVWDITKTYEPGQVVSYNLIPFRATRRHTGIAPRTAGVDSSAWECLGVDARPRVTGSVHVKGGTTGGAQALTAYPVMDFYDSKGAFLDRLDTSTTLTPNLFDSFAAREGAIAFRALDQGSSTWSTANGNWTIGGGLVSPTVPTAAAVAYATGGAANGRVSATFAAKPYGSLEQALIIRWVGGASSNLSTASFIKATRTGLYTYSAGVSTLIGTYATAISDGDRLTVSFVGSTLTVFRNGTQVYTASNALNSTSVNHGMLVS